MNKLIFANLLHRPLRSIISILAVTIEVIMILAIVGIFMGMLNDTKTRTNGIGADLMMRPSNASTMNGISGATMPVKFGEVLPEAAPREHGVAGQRHVVDQGRSRSALRYRLPKLQCHAALRVRVGRTRLRGPMT